MRVDSYYVTTMAAFAACVLCAVTANGAELEPEATAVWIALALFCGGAGLAALTRLRGIMRRHQHDQLRLAHTQQGNQRLLESAHEGLWLLDGRGRTIFGNHKLACMLGVTEAVLGKRSALEFLGENARADLHTVLCADPLLAGVPRDLSYRRADGARGWAIVSGRQVGFDHGLPEGTLLMLTDITERKKAELALATLKADLEVRIRLRTADLTRANEQLRGEIRVREQAERKLAASEQRVNEIINALPIALFLKDPASRITLMNPACEASFGFRQEDAERAHQAVPEIVRRGYEEADRRAFQQRELVTREEPIWIPGHTAFRRHVTYKKPVFAPDGTPLYLICLSVDIEERKRTEEALAHSLAQLRELTAHIETMKDQERRRIACDIHNELGQNLMALKIDVAMLHQRTAHSGTQLGRRVEGALATIDATIRSVRSIINDLHPSTLELGLAAALEWLLGEFRKRSGIDTALDVSGGEGEGLDARVTATVFRTVQEALANVLRHAQARAVTVRLSMYLRSVAVTIEDDGIGMPAGHARGFGLRSVRERVLAMDGWLNIDSAPGAGTRVRLMLPLLPRPQEASASLQEVSVG
jgi:PAS domain S-box-containing protein